MVDLTPGTPLSLTYTGAAASYNVIQAGVVTVKAWGGGGAGGSYTTSGSTRTDRRGGAGGYALFTMRVAVGDVIKVEVGGGGKKATSSTNGGAAGWPDGGFGGYSISAPGICFGGGGGSTRIYLNNVLCAVVAGGGGSTGYYHGGNGGGTSGGVGDAATPGSGGGGTQTAGGGGTPTSSTGAGNFQGANGGPSRTTGINTAGAGGGGGWYGGGSNDTSQPGQHKAGGGGSGLFALEASGAQSIGTADTGTPPNSSDPVLPSTAARGGVCAHTLADTTDGGDGFVYISQDAYSSTSLTTNTYTLSFTGKPERFTAASDGTLTLKMWGGAGAGGSYTTSGSTRTDRKGGAGGYVTAQVALLAGDVVEFWVGEGGKKSNYLPGARGGWPDGGRGGRSTQNSDQIRFGSGGGGTRVYINGVLKLVAAGGGGSTGYYHGGNGGATTGLAGEISELPAARGLGGTQSAGGSQGGAALQGADGNRTNRPDEQTNFAGAGGGGGYYGGGSNVGSTTGSHGAGGGGSSYIASGITGTTLAGTQDTGNPRNETERPSTVAVGGTNASTLASTTDGGHGYVYMTYVGGSPGNASGGIGTITLTAPDGVAQVQASGGIGSMSLTAPSAGVVVGGPPTGLIGTIIITEVVAASATGAAEATPEIGTILVQANLGGQGTVEALVNIPVADEDIVLNSDDFDATATGAAEALIEDLIGTINLTPPTAYIAGFAFGQAFEHDITLTAVLGLAEEGVEAATEPFENSIVLTAGSGAGTGEAYTFPFQSTAGAFAWFTLTPPEAAVASDNVDLHLDLPGPINMTALDGFADDGIDVPTVAFEHSLMLTPPADGGASGGASAVSLQNSYGDSPDDNYLVRVALSAPSATLSAGVNLVTFLTSLDLTLSPPAAITQYGITVLGSILPARIVLSTPKAIALDGNTVLAIGQELEDILLTSPDASAHIQPEVRLPTILMEASDGYVEIDVEGFAPLRFARSIDEGTTPTTLAPREIRFNEADGILFSRNGAGAVAQTPYFALSNGGLAPMGGTPGQVLGQGGAWIDPILTYDAPVRSPPPVARKLLCDAPQGEDAFEIDSALVHYTPFFVPQAIELESLSVSVVADASATAWLGVCSWDIAGTPIDTLASGSVSTAEGLQNVAISVTLEPGWYATMIAVAGIETPEFFGAYAPTTLGDDLTVRGNATAPFSGSLSPPPAPTAYSDTSCALIWGERVG